MDAFRPNTTVPVRRSTARPAVDVDATSGTESACASRGASGASAAGTAAAATSATRQARRTRDTGRRRTPGILRATGLSSSWDRGPVVIGRAAHGRGRSEARIIVTSMDERLVTLTHEIEELLECVVGAVVDASRIRSRPATRARSSSRRVRTAGAPDRRGGRGARALDPRAERSLEGALARGRRARAAPRLARVAPAPRHLDQPQTRTA